MMFGLGWEAWLLLAVAVGLGLAIELRFYLRHRAGISRRDAELR
jgi:hypothetical protein